MKLLITGGAGFIGSHLADRRLAKGDRVVVLDDFNDYYDPRVKRGNVAAHLADPRYRLVEGDIRDRALVFRLFEEERFDGVLHLAARAGVRPSLTQPVLYEEVNCVATWHLLEAAVAHGKPHFVFASSSSVYGINSKLPFSEEDPIDRPISPYATTKRAGELQVFNAHHLHGLTSVCLRFFTVYGPRQRPEMAIARFIRCLETDRADPLLRGRPVAARLHLHRRHRRRRRGGPREPDRLRDRQPRRRAPGDPRRARGRGRRRDRQARAARPAAHAGRGRARDVRGRGEGRARARVPRAGAAGGGL